MDLNNNCCHTDTLSEIKVLFHSNLDHLVLMQCPHCQTHWLYRHHEPQWWNNLMLHENDYEAGYLQIFDEYLPHVEELNFDVLKYCANHPVNFNLTPDK